MRKDITAIVLIFSLIVSCKRKDSESKESSINVSQPLNAIKVDPMESINQNQLVEESPNKEDQEFAKFERDIVVIDKELKKLNAVYDEQDNEVVMLKRELGVLISDGVDVEIPERLKGIFDEHEALSRQISELENQKLPRIRKEEHRRNNNQKKAQQAAPSNH